MVIMAFLRIPSYGLVFLKSTSTDVGKDIQSVGGGFFFPHGDINGMSTMSLITLLLLKKKNKKPHLYPMKKCCTPTRGCSGWKEVPLRHLRQALLRKDGGVRKLT